VKLVVPLVVAAGTAACVGFAWPSFRRSPAEMRLPGTVEVQEVLLGPRVGGRVAAVHVREGQTVEAGRVIATLEARDLVARRDQARHHRESLAAAYEKAYHGPLPEEVAEAKGLADAAAARLAKLRAGPRAEDKEQARQDLAAARADEEQAERTLARVAPLARGPVSPQEYEAALADRDRARGRARAAAAALARLNAGTRAEEIAEAEADADRAAARHALLKRGTRDEDKAAAAAAVAEAEAAVAAAEADVAEATVVAPERCVVDVLPVRAGSVVPAGQPVARVLRADDLWVKAFVPSTDLGKLRLGQAVEVTVDSHPGRRFPGTLVYIASVAEFTPRNVQSVDERRHQVFAVKVRVADPDGVFKSGMAAEVIVPADGGN
jgi:multidrug efflux pump subunit AcrA (membrane-fusion protein)